MVHHFQKTINASVFTAILEQKTGFRKKVYDFFLNDLRQNIGDIFES